MERSTRPNSVSVASQRRQRRQRSSITILIWPLRSSRSYSTEYRGSARKSHNQINMATPPQPLPDSSPETAPQPPFPLKQPPTVILTPWATKYGITPTSVHFNTTYNPDYPAVDKSFYTPVPPIHPCTLAQDNERLNNFTRLQVLRLKGFTTLALIENDIISERQLGEPGLTNPIHPLLARHRREVHMPVSN